MFQGDQKAVRSGIKSKSILKPHPQARTGSTFNPISGTPSGAATSSACTLARASSSSPGTLFATAGTDPRKISLTIPPTRPATVLLLTVLGQKQTSRRVCPGSALPPIADIGCRAWHVRFAPIADIHDLIRSPRRRPGGAVSHRQRHSKQPRRRGRIRGPLPSPAARP